MCHATLESLRMRQVPFWFDTFPKSRRSAYPPLRGAHETVVAIVGGGLTGVSCAFAFATAGIDVLLLEANVIGGGATAESDGLLREGFSGSVQAAIARHGVRTTRALWDGMRGGSLDLAAALRRLNVRTTITPMDVLTVALPRADATKALRREQAARRDAGADASWITPAAASRDAALESGGAIRTRGVAVDPYRACLGLAAAAEERGAKVHERSAVRRVRVASRHVDITTTAGTVRAATVIIATAAPLQHLRALRRHLTPMMLYGVVTEPLSAAIRKEVGRRTTAVEDASEPHRLVRWLPDDRALIRGARQPEVAGRLRSKSLVQRTGQLMYELSLLYPAISGLRAEWSWDTVDYETVDGLPFVGPHRNFPRHLFAFTPARHGAGLSWAAARVLLRHYQQEGSRADEAFGFGRIL
jgi:glycine/D-amino acid oxidase-like deaminating enzyme